jgi:hypothetical protein
MTYRNDGHRDGGASVGILMLDSSFPRIPGDGGNAATWPFPVLLKTISGASPEHAVLRGAGGLAGAFVDGARELVRAGVAGITTSCGFLVLFQAELAEAAGVPVATSSLMQVPAVQALLPPGKRVGILTISAASLTPAHLAAAGVPAETPIGDTAPGGREFARVILGDEPALDVDLARKDLLNGARALVAAYPEIGALVLECTNMAPYSADIAAELGVPVYDFYSFVTWFQAGLRPRRF